MSLWLELDRESLLVHVTGSTSMKQLETALSSEGLTLDAKTDSAETTVATWIGNGAPRGHDPWLDPADHCAAGFSATMGGLRMLLKPAPRRATGPDLFALIQGLSGKLAELHDVWLRVHKTHVTRPSTHAFVHTDPAWTPGEEKLLASITTALTENPVPKRPQ